MLTLNHNSRKTMEMTSVRFNYSNEAIFTVLILILGLTGFCALLVSTNPPVALTIVAGLTLRIELLFNS